MHAVLSVLKGKRPDLRCTLYVLGSPLQTQVASRHPECKGSLVVVEAKGGIPGHGHAHVQLAVQQGPRGVSRPRHLHHAIAPEAAGACTSQHTAACSACCSAEG